MGFSRQEYLSGLPGTPLGDLPDPGIELMSPMSPALTGRFFTTSATWETPSHYHMSYFQKQENCKICNSLSNIEILTCVVEATLYPYFSQGS